MAGEHVHGDAQPEPTVVTSGQEGPHLAFCDLAVAHRGDPGGEELLLGHVQHPRQVVWMVRDVEVRSVAADLHPVDAGKEVTGGIEDPPGRPPSGVAVDQASRGGLGVGRDPGRGEAVGVDREPMAADVHDGDRPVVGRPIQLGCCRVAALGEPVVVVAEAPDRTRPTICPGVLAQQLHHLVHARGHGQVGPAPALAVHEGVGVRIDEPGHQAPTVEVHEVGVAHAAGFGEAPNVGDPTTVQTDRLDGADGVDGHRMDWPTGEDHPTRRHSASPSRPCGRPRRAASATAM